MGQSLSVNAAGAIEFQANIGSGTALTGLTLAGGSLDLLNAATAATAGL